MPIGALGIDRWGVGRQARKWSQRGGYSSKRDYIIWGEIYNIPSLLQVYIVTIILVITIIYRRRTKNLHNIYNIFYFYGMSHEQISFSNVYYTSIIIIFIYLQDFVELNRVSIVQSTSTQINVCYELLVTTCNLLMQVSRLAVICR